MIDKAETMGYLRTIAVVIGGALVNNGYSKTDYTEAIFGVFMIGLMMYFSVQAKRAVKAENAAVVEKLKEDTQVFAKGPTNEKVD